MEIPKTVDEAVKILIDEIVCRDDKKVIKLVKKEDLVLLHHSMGRWIRNNFNLWKGNPELMKDTGVEHPDDASMIIIEKFWEKLNENG